MSSFDHAAAAARAADIVARARAAVEAGGSIFDAFTVAEWTTAIAAGIRAGDVAMVHDALLEMSKHFPHEAELILKTVEVGIAAHPGAQS